MDYDELYDLFRKEKYSDQLQPLPKKIVSDFAIYLKRKREEFSRHQDFFADSLLQEKKQFENSISIFRELMLRRKKKILELVFVASETGIMKRDFSTMLDFEREIFERIIEVIETGDKTLNGLLAGGEDEKENNKMIITQDKIEEFIDMFGNSVGPFTKGELVNLEPEIAEILVSDGKAKFVDVDN